MKAIESNQNLSRRAFLAGATITTVGVTTAGLMGCNASVSEAGGSTTDFWIPQTWDHEADVVVVGYGGAGASTAIAAADKGASVIILEKAPSEGGGSTRMSMGFLYWLSDVERGANHLAALSGGTTPIDVCRAYAEEAQDLLPWIESLGLEVSNVSDNPSPENPVVIDSDTVRGGNIPGMGEVIWPALNKEVKDRGIEILFDTPGVELIQNPKTKEIIGVKAESNGAAVYVKAKKGVALTTGGFLYNEEMKNNFLRLYPFVSYGWRYNTGDGIKMAQKVGASLWHTNFIVGRGTPWFGDLVPAVAGYPGGTPRSANYILVDKFGKRYCNEKALPPHAALLNMCDYDASICEYTRVPIYVIFDETARAAGGLCTKAGGCFIPEELGGHEAWSADNMAEIEKGWILKSDTIEGLAAELNKPNKSYELLNINPKVDPALLKANVDKYNGFCEQGKDTDFGSAPERLAPIITPPFYGMPLWPGCSDNPAGPRRNNKAQIVDPDGNPIPRLYAAGANGSIVGLLYVRGGAFLSDALVFGKIAGKNLADEAPWEA